MSDKNLKIKTIFIISSFIIIVFFIAGSAANTLFHEINLIPINVIYTDIINYSVPTIKVANKDNISSVNSELSLKQTIVDSLGLNFRDPVNIVSKELNYWPDENTDVPTPTFSISPFKLNDSNVQVVKADTPASQAKVDDPSLKVAKRSDKPRVFIYHSHTCESYAPGPANTQDQTVNVCAVGDELERNLETSYNISTIHDKTIHDIYGYINSYDLSGNTLDKYLKTYGDFDLIIDMHRDSVPSKNSVTTKINGETVSSFRFVMTKKNPHFDKNIADVNSLINISNKLFPGLCRETYFYNYGINYYNQNKSNNAMLLEVGSDVSTTTEAKASAKYLARIIAEYLKGK